MKVRWFFLDSIFPLTLLLCSLSISTFSLRSIFIFVLFTSFFLHPFPISFSSLHFLLVVSLLYLLTLLSNQPSGSPIKHFQHTFMASSMAVVSKNKERKSSFHLNDSTPFKFKQIGNLFEVEETSKQNAGEQNDRIVPITKSNELVVQYIAPSS